MPDRIQIYQDQALTNLSVKYTNPENAFAAEQILPRVTVKKESGKYYVYDKGNLRIEDSRQQGTGRANRISRGLSARDYGPLTKHQLEADIPYDEIRLQDEILDGRVDATEEVTEKLLISNEKDAADTLTDTSIVTQFETLAGGDQFSDYDNSNPFQVINDSKETMKKNGIIAPNTIIFTGRSWSVLENHPDFVERIKYSTLGAVTPDNVKTLFPGIQNVIKAEAVYNTAKEGATDNMDYIWGNHILLAYIAPTPGKKKVSLGYTLALDQARKIERWDEPWNNAEFVRIEDYFEQKIVAAEAAFLIKNAVAAE